jgi:hypothetical protein
MFVAVLPIFTVVMSYLIPALFYWQDVDYLTNPLMKPEYIDQGALYASEAILTYAALLILFPVKQVSSLSLGWKFDFNKVTPGVYALVALIFALFCHALYVLAMGGYEALLFPKNRFYVDLPTVKTLALTCGLIAVIIYGLFGKANPLVMLVLAANAALYSFSISSRTSSIFFVLPSLIYFSKRRWMLGFLYFFLAIFLYIDAILGRSTLGIGRFLGLYDMAAVLGDLSEVVFIFYDTFSALQTLTIAFSIGQLSAFPAWLEFALYISPIPSSLLDIGKYRQFQSLSFHMGIDIGINSDIMSETYLWFGWGGAFVAGFIYYALYRLIKSKDWRGFYPLLVVAFIYFCVMSNVGSLRAASRPLVYVISAYLFIIYSWRFARFCSDKASNLVQRGAGS